MTSLQELGQMAASVRITKRGPVADGGIVYDWEIDDSAKGHVLLREDTEVIRPCTPSAVPIGDMLARRGSGDVENPNPVTRKDFVVVVAALFQEWKRRGHPPEAVMRTYW
ncbi:hypothetical protein [Streptomyces sp. NPDC058307]|uniref:hypothetical protein n=1 Tax=Streptomyces sp. NPDC058307 TaxID=3346439 RepID=UPI0036EEC605